MKKPRGLFIAGNWKMQKTKSSSVSFLETFLQKNKNLPRIGFESLKVSLLPNFLDLPWMAEKTDSHPLPFSFSVYAQNFHEKLEGAFTGEVSISQLKEHGVYGALLGHSERRQYFGETDEKINQKLLLGLSQKMEVMVALGETLEQRESENTFNVLSSQIDRVFGAEETCNEIAESVHLEKRLSLAYEPVWAIGTGKTATPEQAEEVHEFLREQLTKKLGASIADRIRILYGGSVKPENALELLSQKNIDGALIGGASLDVESFSSILKTAYSLVS